MIMPRAERLLLIAAVVGAALFMAPTASAQSTTGTEVERLTRALAMQLELSYASNRPEYARRYHALADAINAWNASAQTSADREQFTHWLRMSIRASMPGVSKVALTPPVFEVAKPANDKALPEPNPVSEEPSGSPDEVAVEVLPPQPVTEPIESSAAPIVDPEIAARLWAESPASAPLDLEQLAREASQHKAPEHESPEVLAEQQAALPPAPEPRVERPRPISEPSQEHVARLEQALAPNTHEDSDDLPPLEPLSVVLLPSEPELVPLDLSDPIYDSPVRKSPRGLAEQTPLPEQEGDSALPLVQLTQTAAADSATRVTALRPANDPPAGDPSGTPVDRIDPQPAGPTPGKKSESAGAEDGAPVSEATSTPTFDVAKIKADVLQYGKSIERIESSMAESLSPSAFELASWGQELARLGKQRQFTSLYLAGIDASDREQIPEFASAREAIALLRDSVQTRRHQLSDLPEQAVRAELEALESVERNLPAIEEDNR